MPSSLEPQSKLYIHPHFYCEYLVFEVASNHLLDTSYSRLRANPSLDASYSRLRENISLDASYPRLREPTGLDASYPRLRLAIASLWTPRIRGCVDRVIAGL